MSRSLYIFSGFLVLLVVVGVYLIRDHQQALSEPLVVYTEIVQGYDSEPLLPLPAAEALDKDKVELGQRLFHDPQLSRDNTVSCASCHNLKAGGDDDKPISTGIGGAMDTLNAPTVFNSSFNIAQFWDGRAASLEEQAAGPVHNPIEMGSNWDEVLAKLVADHQYPEIFDISYPDGITADNIVDAIVTFERSLVTPDGRFDRYLRGDTTALNSDEIEGYRRFKQYGCVSCHQGIGIGGNMYQRFGVVKGYFDNRPLSKEDLGRFNVTGQEQDRHVFKVPSLRNITLTAPYLHDGSAQSLEEVVQIMGQYQLGNELSDQDVDLIVAFLGTLTGRWNGEDLQ
ncbi:MAG: cytochrome-c peroxidase [Motiliproteus sp.]